MTAPDFARTRVRCHGLVPLGLSIVTTMVTAQPVASIELTARRYDARETAPGDFVLNREHGRLHGFALSVADDSPLGRWRLQAGREGAAVGYQGLDQLGRPISTTTDLRVDVLALRWIPAVATHLGAARLSGYLELAQHRLERAIRPGPRSLALSERLDTTWLRGGLQLAAPLAPSWLVRAEATRSWPLVQGLRVDTGGLYEPFRLEPRRRPSDRWSLAVSWVPSAGWRLGLTASDEVWRFGAADARPVRRDGVVAGTAAYPGSRQRLRGWTLQLERDIL